MVCVLRLYPLLSSRLGSSFSCCAPAATNPKVYAHYAARLAACRGYHIGSLQELPQTACTAHSIKHDLKGTYSSSFHTSATKKWSCLPCVLSCSTYFRWFCILHSRKTPACGLSLLYYSIDTNVWICVCACVCIFASYNTLFVRLLHLVNTMR